MAGLQSQREAARWRLDPAAPATYQQSGNPNSRLPPPPPPPAAWSPSAPSVPALGGHSVPDLTKHQGPTGGQQCWALASCRLVPGCAPSSSPCLPGKGDARRGREALSTGRPGPTSGVVLDAIMPLPEGSQGARVRSPRATEEQVPVTLHQLLPAVSSDRLSLPGSPTSRALLLQPQGRPRATASQHSSAPCAPGPALWWQGPGCGGVCALLPPQVGACESGGSAPPP